MTADLLEIFVSGDELDLDPRVERKFCYGNCGAGRVGMIEGQRSSGSHRRRNGWAMCDYGRPGTGAGSPPEVLHPEVTERSNAASLPNQ